MGKTIRALVAVQTLTRNVGVRLNINHVTRYLATLPLSDQNVDAEQGVGSHIPLNVFDILRSGVKEKCKKNLVSTLNGPATWKELDIKKGSEVITLIKWRE